MSNYGESTRTINETDNILVCSRCGSTQVQLAAIVDANTHDYIASLDNTYCVECGDSNDLITKKEWEEKQKENESEGL